VIDEKTLAALIEKSPPKCGEPYEKRPEFANLSDDGVNHLLDYLIVEGRARGWPLNWYDCPFPAPRGRI
jgi:hypothetical protein